MSSQSFQPTPSVREPSPEAFAPGKSMRLEAIRLVSLPSEIQAGGDVFHFVKNVLSLEPISVNIVQMQTESGVRYRSAFVDIASTGEEDPQFIHAIMNGFASVRGIDISGGIHFDNGKPMSHIKIVPAKKHAPSKEPLILEAGEWTSIYIPVITEDLTMDNGDVRLNDEDELAAFFEDKLKVGKVSRIDFMSKPVPNSDRVAKCAYVHFDQWYDNQTAKLVRKTITAKGEFSCNGFYDGFEFCRFDKNRYINLKVNHKPIPAATEDMNVHQLAARVKILEEQNAELERQNEQVRADYSDVCIHRSNQIMSMMEREQKIRELEEQLSKPLTIEEMFMQLRKKMDQLKVVSKELLEKHGSNDAVEAAGVWELPEYKEYAFDYIGALNELYDEFVPVIFR